MGTATAAAKFRRGTIGDEGLGCGAGREGAPPVAIELKEWERRRVSPSLRERPEDMIKIDMRERESRGGGGLCLCWYDGVWWINDASNKDGD